MIVLPMYMTKTKIRLLGNELSETRTISHLTLIRMEVLEKASKDYNIKKTLAPKKLKLDRIG